MYTQEKAGGEYVVAQLRKALGGQEAFDVVDEHSVFPEATRTSPDVFRVGVFREPRDPGVEKEKSSETDT